jgi:multiple sugar transport system permease protein
MSLFEYDQSSGKCTYVGCWQFTQIAKSPEFVSASLRTMIWTSGCVFGQIAFGMVVALALWKPFPGNRVARSVVLLPWVIPDIASLTVWRWLLHPSEGPLNQLLSTCGIAPVNWLGDPYGAFGAVILVCIWKGWPFACLILLAHLDNMQECMFEAAALDGAGSVGCFRYITLPQLTPTLHVLTMFSTIWTVNSIEIILVLTGGGPIESTTTLPLLGYRYAFSEFRFGRASAIVTMVGAINLLLLILYGLWWLLVHSKRATQTGSTPS